MWLSGQQRSETSILTSHSMINLYLQTKNPCLIDSTQREDRDGWERLSFCSGCLSNVIGNDDKRFSVAWRNNDDIHFHYMHTLDSIFCESRPFLLVVYMTFIPQARFPLRNLCFLYRPILYLKTLYLLSTVPMDISLPVHCIYLCKVWTSDLLHFPEISLDDNNTIYNNHPATQLTQFDSTKPQRAEEQLKTRKKLHSTVASSAVRLRRDGVTLNFDLLIPKSNHDAPVTKVWRKFVNRYWRYRGNIKLPRESRTDGRTDGRTAARTDDPKTYSLRRRLPAAEA